MSYQLQAFSERRAAARLSEVARRGTIIGPGAYRHEGGERFVLSLIDLDAEKPEPRLIDIGFLGHGVAVDPGDPARAAVFEKKGKGACLVDLRSGALVREIPTADNRQFYGHGAFSADGALLYTTESVLDDGLRGVLIVRDAATLEELGEVATFGTAPHDCQLLPDGTTMMVANGGGKIRGGAMPSVVFLDVKSEALLERIELREERFNAGHVARTAAGDVAVVSAPRDGLPDLLRQKGGVTLVPRGKPPNALKRPSGVTDRMLGEALSVAIYEPQEKVVATHPYGNMVSMWRLSDGALLGTLDDLVEPRGVTLTLDREHLVLSHRVGRSVGISVLGASDMSVSTATRINPSYTSGSHLFSHDLI
jgi:hypothetical protein